MLPQSVDYSQYPPDIQLSIKKYEDFIINQLQPDLKQTLELRDTIYNRISEYLKLKTYVQTILSQGLDELNTRVDLGSDFYLKAYVVGFGFHLQMTLSEADIFIDEKVNHMEKLADKYTDAANETRAKIKMVYGALTEVLGLN